MSAVSPSPTPQEPLQPGGFALWCGDCGTDAHLVIESIQAQGTRPSQALAVFYTCTACGFSYNHPATVQQAGAILNRRGIQDGLLQFGSRYFHCGEPMKDTETALRSVEAPVTGQPPSGDFPRGVHLHTKLLKCRCGFEFEIPT